MFSCADVFKNSSKESVEVIKGDITPSVVEDAPELFPHSIGQLTTVNPHLVVGINVLVNLIEQGCVKLVNPSQLDINPLDKGEIVYTPVLCRSLFQNKVLVINMTYITNVLGDEEFSEIKEYLTKCKDTNNYQDLADWIFGNVSLVLTLRDSNEKEKLISMRFSPALEVMLYAVRHPSSKIKVNDGLNLFQFVDNSERSRYMAARFFKEVPSHLAFNPVAYSIPSHYFGKWVYYAWQYLEENPYLWDETDEVSLACDTKMAKKNVFEHPESLAGEKNPIFVYSFEG